MHAQVFVRQGLWCRGDLCAGRGDSFCGYGSALHAPSYRSLENIFAFMYDLSTSDVVYVQIFLHCAPKCIHQVHVLRQLSPTTHGWADVSRLCVCL